MVHIHSIDFASDFQRGLTWRSFSFSSVKLRIKSFRVPELFVDIPESATIGSLKV